MQTLFFIPCTFSRSPEFKSMSDCMLTLLVAFSGSLALLAKWEKRSYPVSKGDFLFCIPLDVKILPFLLKLAISSCVAAAPRLNDLKEPDFWDCALGNLSDCVGEKLALAC
ncbi:hypothetical protein IHE44_0000578 [Lamprotornis superbus]|uniref:Uncharacterized protein n=1 Tax=Lamprotornis superbus TaxID=245042 RepID=A0A835P2N0_9PASS|nr:hypothetical protein IHE44_0000578 [Lamprotornis superbus]